jgi:hypothetical protein
VEDVSQLMCRCAVRRRGSTTKVKVMWILADGPRATKDEY